MAGLSPHVLYGTYIKKNKNASADKAKDNWHLVKTILNTENTHYSSIKYRNLPVHDITTLLNINAKTSKYPDTKIDELYLARESVKKHKSAQSATNAAIIAIDEYHHNTKTSIAGNNLSNLFDLFKVTYQSSIHEQFYKLVTNTTNWDISQRKPILSKEINLSSWKSTRKKLLKSHHGLADYSVIRSHQPKPHKKQQSFSSILAKAEEINLMISTSIYSIVVTAKDEDFRKLSRMIDEVQNELEKAKEIRNINR